MNLGADCRWTVFSLFWMSEASFSNDGRPVVVNRRAREVAEKDIPSRVGQQIRPGYVGVADFIPMDAVQNLRNVSIPLNPLFRSGLASLLVVRPEAPKLYSFELNAILIYV